MLDMNRVHIVKGDITKQDVDAIVNAAKNSLLGGGGVDGAIHAAGGRQILEECKNIIREIGELKTGKAVITSGGKLKAKYVIHTVGPIWHGGQRNEEILLANAYKNSLKVASEKGIKTIAFPSISTGVYGVPKEIATKIAFDTVMDCLREYEKIEQVRFICFDNYTYKLYEDLIYKKIENMKGRILMKIKLEDLGPRLIINNENKFTRKCRILQAYYRTIVLQKSFGNGPGKNDNLLGSMLKEREINDKNFITKEIFDYAKDRVENKKLYETIDEYRLFNNMLSSQPMCFNLFVPLKNAIKQYPDFVNNIFSKVFPELNIKAIKNIEIEFIPSYYKELINDKTAFDAFIEYEDKNSLLGIIGVETKYTDKLGNNKGKNTTINFDLSDIFTTIALDRFKNEGCNQLTRNILLTESYRVYNKLENSCSVILSPKDDPSTSVEINGFKDNFCCDWTQKLKRVFLEEFVSTIRENSPDEYYKLWIESFYNRYLNFELLNDVINYEN